MFVGLMGGVYAYFLEAIAPASVFDPTFDLAMVLMAFMGGLGTLAGPILGAVIVEPAQQYFALQFGASGWYLVLYGALFLAVILLLPEGIVPTVRRRWKSLKASGGSTTGGVIQDEPALLQRGIKSSSGTQG
jgi:branched-chain amino acid transport system permease protein